MVNFRNKKITLYYPTEDQFKNLPSYSHCPCSCISLLYDEFTKIKKRFHQICSSNFISDRWIKTINSGSNVTYVYYNDFQTDGSAAFQALSTFLTSFKRQYSSKY